MTASYKIIFTTNDVDGNERYRTENVGSDYDHACAETRYHRSMGRRVRLEVYYTVN